MTQPSGWEFNAEKTEILILGKWPNTDFEE